MASGHTSDPADVMTGDDYSAPAEIFVSRRPGSKRSTLAYHRFATATEAIAFAVEEFPSMSANGLVMTVQNKRFDLGALRTLHSASNKEPEDPGEGSSE